MLRKTSVFVVCCVVTRKARDSEEKEDKAGFQSSKT